MTTITRRMAGEMMMKRMETRRDEPRNEEEAESPPKDQTRHQER